MLAMQQTNWWERLATYGWNFVPQTIEQRERVRRSRVNAWIILGLMVLVVILAGMIGVDIGTLVAIVSFVCSLAIAFFLNRAGLVYWTGAILVISFTAAVVLGIILPGALATDDLPAFDLLVIPLIIAGTALPRAFSFLVMAMNSGIIIGLYFLLPHTSDLMVDVTSYPSLTVAIITFLGRPIALYVVVAFVEFLWVGSTDRAIRRADQAEALAELERRYADQQERYAQQQTADADARATFIEQLGVCFTQRIHGDVTYVILPSRHPYFADALRFNSMLRAITSQAQNAQIRAQQVIRALIEYVRTLSSVMQGMAVARLDPAPYDPTGYPELDALQWGVYALLRPELPVPAQEARKRIANLITQHEVSQRSRSRPPTGERFGLGSGLPQFAPQPRAQQSSYPARAQWDQAREASLSSGNPWAEPPHQVPSRPHSPYAPTDARTSSNSDDRIPDYPSLTLPERQAGWYDDVQDVSRRGQDTNHS